MAWDDSLLPEQKTAAEHLGRPARLLAGPGTGKTLTLTRHICFLIAQQHISPTSILAVTFTRAAARELRQRVVNELGQDQCPHISTLHSFALRQLMKNAVRITELPQPLRIADNWEERNIILEDVKSLLDLKRISEASNLVNELSADWQSLTADDADWEKRFPNPQFLGAWREHRRIYGYTLRAELVYQLKKALEQRGDFELEGPLAHLLVDEYQDLNRCDLAIVQRIANHGIEVYVAGDDDQSIYGFRKAHPEGIRRFPQDYSGASSLSLETCKRCDCDILDLALFVARQDPRRIGKRIVPEPGRGRGEVVLLRFPTQDEEAGGVAAICAHLTGSCGLQPDDILILLRSDRNKVFSNPIRLALEQEGIPVAATTDGESPLDTGLGRAMLALFRLAVNIEDSLAWRTLLKVWCSGIGPGAVGTIYDAARSRGMTFAQTILAAYADPSLLPSNHRERLVEGFRKVTEQLNVSFPASAKKKQETCDGLLMIVHKAAKSLIEDETSRSSVMIELQRAARAANATSIEDLVRATQVSDEDIEQDVESGKVNVLSMHRAKGLTAKAVIIPACEDQYIPGRARGDAIDDERRLLYVSLTRAKHHLFVTYCDRRTGSQCHTGRDSGKMARSLTQFLVDCPYTPQDGTVFIDSLGQARP